MEKRIYVKRNIWFRIKRFFLLCFAVPILFVISKIWCRWKTNGKKNLKSLKNSGCVVVVNHCHVMDSVMAALTLLPRKARITTLASNCQIKVAGRILRTFGCVPIKKGFNEIKQMMTEVTDEAKQGGTILFMPEGHLVKDCSELREFKTGAFRVAKSANVPIVPMAISYSLTKRNKFKYTLNIGRPIQSQDLTTNELKEAAHSVISEFIKDNKKNVELRYGADVYSGDPKGERIWRMMQEKKLDRQSVEIYFKEKAIPEADIVDNHELQLTVSA